MRLRLRAYDAAGLSAERLLTVVSTYVTVALSGTVAVSGATGINVRAVDAGGLSSSARITVLVPGSATAQHALGGYVRTPGSASHEVGGSVQTQQSAQHDLGGTVRVVAGSYGVHVRAYDAAGLSAEALRTLVQPPTLLHGLEGTVTAQGTASQRTT